MTALLGCSQENGQAIGTRANDLTSGPPVEVHEASHLLGLSTLSAVAGAEFYDSTTLVIADRVEGIAVLGLGGAVETLGRRGFGPGEYQRVTAVVRHLGSEGVTFYDHRAGRYLTWRRESDPQGARGLVASRPSPLPGGTIPMWRRGDSVFALREPLDRAEPDSAALVVLRLDGGGEATLLRIKRRPFARVTTGSGGSDVTTFIPLPLASRDFIAPLPSGDIVILSADRRSLMRFNPTGSVVTEVPVDVSPRSVGPEEMSEAQQALEETAGRPVDVTLPSEHAPFTSLTTSRSGEVLIGLVPGLAMTEYLWLDQNLSVRLKFRLDAKDRVIAFSPPFVFSTRLQDTGLVLLRLSCVLAGSPQGSATNRSCSVLPSVPD